MNYFENEKRVIKGFLSFFLPKGGETVERFGVLQGSGYPMIFALVIVACMFEIPMMHFLIEFLMEDSTTKTVIQVSLLVSTAYAIVWLGGDYQLLKSGGVYLQDDQLVVDFSIRWRATIPVSQILLAERSTLNVANEIVKDWRKKDEKIPLEKGVGHLKLGVETPNVRLKFVSPHKFYSIFGRTSDFHEVHFFVTQPDRLISSINLTEKR